MTILPVVIKGQTLQKGNGFPEVVEKSKDWLCLEFEGLPSDADSASVYFELSWEYGKTYDALITNNSCVIPEYCTTLPKHKNEFVDYVVYVSVAAIVDGKRFTTDKLEIKIDQTAYKEKTENTPEIPPSQFEEFVRHVDENAEKAENAAQRAQEYAESVQQGVIPDGYVTGNKIANGAVSVSKLSDMAVTTNKLDLEAVTNNRIAPLAISTDKVRDKSITKEKLSDDVKQLIEDAGNIDLSNYYTKPETDAAIDKKVDALRYDLDNGAFTANEANFAEHANDAVADRLGNVIDETYATKKEVDEKTIDVFVDTDEWYIDVDGSMYTWYKGEGLRYGDKDKFPWGIGGTWQGVPYYLVKGEEATGGKCVIDIRKDNAQTGELADNIQPLTLHALGNGKNLNDTIVYKSPFSTHKEVDAKLGDIDTALDAILAIQAELIGGDV